MNSSIDPDQNRRILVVDDNRAIHDDMRKILHPDDVPDPDLELDEKLLFDTAPVESASFEIDSAYQGQEGLAMVQKALANDRPYALAFVDVRMPPGWDGVETIGHLWKVDPSLQVVICTAYSDYTWSDIRNRLGNSGNLLILKKPFDNIEVIQLAHALTEKWEMSIAASRRMKDLDWMVACRTVELQTAEEAFRTVFEASPIGIALSDMDGRYLDVNQAFSEMFGIRRSDIVGKDAVELGWLEGRSDLHTLGQKLASFGGVDAQEVAYPHPVWGARTGLLWLREVTIRHQPHVLSFGLDITDRKRMEEELERARIAAEAAVRAKSEFLATMSHEIRTPLNGVLGLSALLNDDIPGEARHVLRLIRTSGETLAKILDDVLDFSKIEAGKLEIEQAEFSLREALEWSVALFQPRAVAKHLNLEWRVADDIPERILGDSTRIKQVVTNLMSNAIKFTEEGVIEVTAALASQSAGGYRVRIEVRDTGIGIPAEKMDRLFRPFSQVEAATNRRYGGTGLGLVICRRLVEMMGGSIEVTSEPDKGSTFRFDFLAGIPAPGKAEAPAGPPVNLDTLRVLVVEDNQVNQIVCQRLLRKFGCTVDVVCDGGAAVNQVRDGHYDLVLMDVQMPGVDGLEATERIRALSPPSSQIPIIALTASASAEDREVCLRAGMDDYVSKPVDLQSLRNALERWGRPSDATVLAPEQVGAGK